MCFISFQFSFEIDILFYCIPYLVYIKSMLVDKASAVLFGMYVNRNNCVVKTIFVVFFIGRAVRTSWISLIALCYSLFLWMFITLTKSHSFSFSAGLFFWWAFFYYMRFLTYMACWLWPANCTLVNVSYITSVSLLQVYLCLIRVWCVTGWLLYTNISHTPIRFMHPFGQ